MILVQFDPFLEINSEYQRSFIFVVYKIEDFTKSIFIKFQIKTIYPYFDKRSAGLFDIFFLFWVQFNIKQVLTNWILVS